ncbi:MAG: PSD1 and planctomycete cytochrome C domain-containing protein [Anditalea sp.]
MKKLSYRSWFSRKGLMMALVLLLFCNITPFLILNGYAETGASEGSDPFWLWQFLGRLHPLAVHFPVSLLLFAAVLELFTIKNFNSKLRPGINMLVGVGALSAVLAALLGWLLATQENYGGDILAIHQWTGIATAGLGVIALFLLSLIVWKNQWNKVKIYRGVLFFTAIGVSVAGHFGASLTHGEEYLTSVVPWSEDYAEKPEVNFDFAAFESDSSGLSEEQEMNLIGEVRAVMAHNCYNCHSSEKIEGELRLDERKFVFAGGESGPIIQPGAPSKSEIVRRINLPRDHKESMPSKGKKLSGEEIALITFWIEKGAPWPDGAENQSVFRVAELAPRKPDLPSQSVGLTKPVDLLVNDYFKVNNIEWSASVDDRTYLRRIYLDIIGLVPTPEELDSFSKDKRSDKREIWVRQLLDRDDDYAMHWLTFWNDALRNDYTGTGYITGGRSNITDWLYKSLKSNKPYNQFVQELLDPDEESKGFIEGIKWRGTVNASQRTEMQAAQNVGQVILGLNLKCASCHDSFISDWKLEDAYAFANIFADSVLEISRCEKPTGKMAKTKILWEELGEIDSTDTKAKKLEQLAEKLTQPANGRIYRTIVNRIWAQMMGRGIVEPVDIMDNEPWSQDLLDWLASDFVESNYDMKELIYKIATSNTYQLPSVGMDDPSELLAEDFQFEGMVRKRITAEQFSDAVSMVISPVFPDSVMKYNPFELVVDEKSDFSFARASLVANNNLLSALGRTSREVVSTTRDSEANLLQTLELTNGERLNSVLLRGAEQWKEKYKQSDVIIEEFYEKALGRKPEQKEFVVAKQALGESPSTESIQDLFWAVLLLPEFQIIY